MVKIRVGNCNKHTPKLFIFYIYVLTGVVQIDGALCKVNKAIEQPVILHVHRRRVSQS